MPSIDRRGVRVEQYSSIAGVWWELIGEVAGRWFHDRMSEWMSALTARALDFARQNSTRANSVLVHLVISSHYERGERSPIGANMSTTPPTA